ncbi:histone deacetylase 8-like isoform X2 [Rhynchophorus ferrugineus]|uniref:histone deacetylase 8-like isoform X2 n=1 Tax=Rhynchophorus ferrugineus TaxID=354439 RepID=UPI003FCC8E93
MTVCIKDKIVYLYSQMLIDHCDKIPSMKNRASIVQDLVRSYNLLSQNNIIVVKPTIASDTELKSFHSSDYIDLLKSINSYDPNLDEIGEKHLEYGLGYDNEPVENIYDFVSYIAGCTLYGAKLLASRKCNTVINWFGGWHHAQRDHASGFCYINDIVIGIQLMARYFRKILYVDLDIHHGDGVQNAFEYSNNILTLSFHKYSYGFFPNTGNVDEVGCSKGKFYSINVPLKDGVCDKTYVNIFKELFPIIVQNFKPDVFVVQCGADGLNGDTLGQCNLTLKGIGECVNQILGCNKPIMLLGGGGYNFANTARLWTYLTSLVTKTSISNDIPDTCEYFMEYTPSYELHIEQGKMKDCNTIEYVTNTVQKIKTHCANIS